MYTNSRLLTKGKEKDEKKWCANNVDSEDSYSALKEDIKVHGDPDFCLVGMMEILWCKIQMGKQTIAHSL
jgi:hypothetical protein